MDYKPHFLINATEHDEQGNATNFELHFFNSEDARRAQEIMKATGVATELETLFMVFRRY